MRRHPSARRKAIVVTASEPTWPSVAVGGLGDGLSHVPHPSAPMTWCGVRDDEATMATNEPACIACTAGRRRAEQILASRPDANVSDAVAMRLAASVLIALADHINPGPPSLADLGYDRDAFTAELGAFARRSRRAFEAALVPSVVLTPSEHPQEAS